jgi:hypothetical protein
MLRERMMRRDEERELYSCIDIPASECIFISD